MFDNFETVRTPAEAYKWLDTYVRPPNKVLITTQFREFKGDYDVTVSGMEESECDVLIDSVSAALGVRSLLTDEYRRDLKQESNGHPYVIKILLGEVAKVRQLVKVERIVASRENILDALFERTFAGLSPAARRVFLTLCNWRSALPQVALEAVLLRASNERMDVDLAVDELLRSSLIEVSQASTDNSPFISVPLAASVFGQRKLGASPSKVAVEADTRILQSFGATQPSGIRHGLGPRIEVFFRNIAKRLRSNPKELDEYLPILESVARKYAPAWLLLSSLHEEMDCPGSLEPAKEAVRRFLEATPKGSQESGWRRLAALCARTSDWLGEIQALVELADLPGAPFNEISSAANRLNGLFRDRRLELDSDDKQVLVRRLIGLMENRMAEADAVDCSRLAWLCLQLRDEERARRWTKHGVALDPNNAHCQRLATKLGWCMPAEPYAGP